MDKYYLIEIQNNESQSEQYLLYRNNKFVGFNTLKEANRECTNLEFASEFGATFTPRQYTIDQIKVAVQEIPYHVFDIHSGLLRCEGVPIKNSNVRSDPFDKSFNREYEMAKKAGDKRFGSECKHEHIKNGYCTDCLRKVVTQ